MNNASKENCLVPSILGFAMRPRFPIINTDLPTQKHLTNAIKTAQAEINSIVSE